MMSFDRNITIGKILTLTFFPDTPLPSLSVTRIVILTFLCDKSLFLTFEIALFPMIFPFLINPGNVSVTIILKINDFLRGNADLIRVSLVLG